MKKSLLLIILKITLPLLLYSQSYQFNIIDEFDLKLPNLFCLTYDNHKLWIYDSSYNKIYAFDTIGACLDSITLSNYNINGIDFYNDTIFALKKENSNKNSTILKINPQNGEIYDSVNWFIGDETDFSEYLAVNEKSFLSYISAGWSSSIVQLDKFGIIINSVFTPGLGSFAGISCCNSNKFCFVSSLGNDKNGYFFEYKIGENEINNLYSTEIPVHSPKGIACIDDSSFYTYSEADKKMYKLSKTGLNPNQINQSVLSTKVTIYPNPSNGIVYIKSKIPIEKIDILSINGQLIQSINSNQSSLNVNEYQKGYYILLFYSNKSKIYKSLIIN
jgi:hypothetical protein